jgi:hypothetical protein
MSKQTSHVPSERSYSGDDGLAPSAEGQDGRASIRAEEFADRLHHQHRSDPGGGSASSFAWSRHPAPVGQGSDRVRQRPEQTLLMTRSKLAGAKGNRAVPG